MPEKGPIDLNWRGSDLSLYKGIFLLRRGLRLPGKVDRDRGSREMESDA